MRVSATLLAILATTLSIGCESAATKACKGKNVNGNANVPPGSPAKNDCEHCCSKEGAYFRGNYATGKCECS